MNDIPNIIDIDGYCEELSNITGIDISIIRYIVLYNFAKMYGSSQDNLSFPEAIDNIEKQINNILENSQSPKAKPRNIIALQNS